jgi:quinol-cytochrome oxidoreductase complex cytochrome b subunit
VGEEVRFLLIGGTEVGETALIPFYVLHCVVLPLAAVLFIAVHIWRLRKDGGLFLPPRENPR